MFGVRWVVGVGALLLSFIALWVLLRWEDGRDTERMIELTRPALDEIDEESRNAMRELLRQEEKED